MTMKTIAGAAAMVAVAGMMAGCCQECGKKEVKMYTNKEFYAGGSFDADGINKDGKFDAAKGKAAYFDLMRRFGYPVFPSFKDDKLTNPKDGSQYLGFWATDFAKGDFMKFGNIFLLPFQSIAEHSHVAGKQVDKSFATDRWTGEVYTKGIPAKMESWLVRHGSVYSFSEVGEPNLDKFPEAKKNLSALLFDHKADKPTLLKSARRQLALHDGRRGRRDRERVRELPRQHLQPLHGAERRVLMRIPNLNRKGE